MHALSSGSIEAVRFDSLVTLVRGDECIAFELSELEDLLKVVQLLVDSRRAASDHAALERALEAGAMDDYEDLGPTIPPVAGRADVQPDTQASDGVVEEPMGEDVDDVELPAPPPPTPVRAAPVPVRPPEPSATAIPASLVPSASDKRGEKRPANEIITAAVLQYLDKRVRPQSFDRILRAIRKDEGVPEDVAKTLMELLKRLVKKGALVRSPTGGFSVDAA